MSSPRNHIVRRQVVAVEVATQQLGQACLQGLRGTLQPMLQACLEKVLADFDPADGQTLHLERLELDLGTLRLGSLAQDLPATLEGELRKALALAARDVRLPAGLQGAMGAGPLAQARPAAARAVDAWLHFFKVGCWPWWHAPQDGPEPPLPVLLAACMADGLAADAQACLRLAHWIGKERFSLVWEHFGLEGIYPALEEYWRGAMLDCQPAAQDAALPALVLRLALSGPGNPGALAATVLAGLLGRSLALASSGQASATGAVWAEAYRLWRSGTSQARGKAQARWMARFQALADAVQGVVWPDLTALESVHTPAPAHGQSPALAPTPVCTPAPAKAETPLYIDNAGLVLLHPFVQPLLEGLGLTEGPAFVDAAAASYSALLLHHLVWGAAPEDESALVLNKVLCGLEPGHFIDITQPVALAHLAELEEVLAAVCQHWKELRHAHNDDLRRTFLQRSGKLHLGSPMQLVVDRQTIDLIVDRLPWAVSLVRLPWMGGMLEVRW